MAVYTKVLMPACTFFESGAAIHWEQRLFWSLTAEGRKDLHYLCLTHPVADGASQSCEFVVEGIGDVLPHGRQPGLATIGRWCHPSSRDFQLALL